MNKYIDEIIAGRQHTALALELPAAVWEDYTAWLSHKIITALTEQERRIKEDIAAKVEATRRDIPKPTSCTRKVCESCAEMHGYNSALNKVKSLLTPLPSSTEE